MERVASYGMGCGAMLVLAGVVELIGLALGWGESNKAIFQILKIVGNMVGSDYLGAGIYIVAGVAVMVIGWAIPEIMRGDEPAKTEQNGSVRPQAVPVQLQYQEVEQSPAERYLNFAQNNFIRNGFESVPLSYGNTSYYKRDAGQSSEFYFIPGRVNGLLTPEKVEKISQKTFEDVSKRKRANTLFCYPVIVSEAVPAQVQKFIQNYHPKHMAQFEFPVIVDLSTRKLFYYTGTPLWGGVMYKGIRENAKALLKIP